MDSARGAQLNPDNFEISSHDDINTLNTESIFADSRDEKSDESQFMSHKVVQAKRKICF